MNYDPITGLSIVLIIVIVIGGLFLALRFLVLWYWRINRIIDLLEQQNKILEVISTQNQRNVSRPVITRNPPQP